jgi:hypothetical protein
MSAFEEHKEELEHFEQMFGRDRGRLAVSLDRLTNALVSLASTEFIARASVILPFPRWTCG